MLLSIIVAAALGTAYHDTVIAMAIGNVAALSRILRGKSSVSVKKNMYRLAQASNCSNFRDHIFTYHPEFSYANDH